MRKENIIFQVIEYFSGREDVEVVYLFGSRAEDNYNKTSDLDLGLILNPYLEKKQAFDIKLSISAELEDRIGLEVDIVIFSLADLRLQHQIIRGELLLGKNSILRIKKEVEVMRNYRDMRRYFNRYEKMMGRKFEYDK